jgi:hypothetical protein
MYFETEVSKKILEINNLTNKESFEKGRQQGAIGWEYAFSILFFIDNIYISKVISGNYQSVSIGHKYNFVPTYTEQNKKVEFEIQLDDKKYKTKIFETEKIRENLIYGIAINFHTHPKYLHMPGISQYTFFSPQDIASLLNGSAPVQGLVMGPDLWLACRTKDSKMISPNLLSEASRIELNQGVDKIELFIKQNFKEFGIVFYHGKVGGKIKRI